MNNILAKRPIQNLDQYRKTFITQTLRRASRFWPPKNDCLISARVERGFYKCNMCGDVFKKKEIQVDHIIPIIDVKTGFTDYNDFVFNLFCHQDNLQCLCIPCHNGKTSVENERRKINKKKQK